MTASATYLREWRARNSERVRAYNVAYRQANRERLNEADRQRYAKSDRSAEIARKHNLTVDQRLAMIASGCAICGYQPTDDEKSLAIDHDHSCCPGPRSCGKCIRGALCDNCNRGLGFFQDDPERLRKAVEYLEGWR